MGPKQIKPHHITHSGWIPETWGALDLSLRGPDPPEEIISGVLRGYCHLQMSSGPKMKKSFTLIDLALSVATGSGWLGLDTQAGPVFYADAENQPALIRQRITAVANSRGISLKDLNDSIRFAPLRGQLNGKSLADVVDGVILSIKEMTKPPVLAIMEPLYLLLRGARENEAEDITRALEELDRVCQETGCGLVYSHHFSKGSQALKKSLDRSSGSGALSRYPDGIMTINPPPERMKAKDPNFSCDAIVEITTRWFPPIDPFPVWWSGAHYHSRPSSYRVATPRYSSMAGRYGELIKAMPALCRDQARGECPIIKWISDSCGVSMGESEAIFSTLRSGAYTGKFLVSLGNGVWKGATL